MSKRDYWVLAVIFIVVCGWWVIWNKPTCRDGFVRLFGPFDGWNCVSGYKP
jgi:hypothetical protein